MSLSVLYQAVKNGQVEIPDTLEKILECQDSENSDWETSDCLCWFNLVKEGTLSKSDDMRATENHFENTCKGDCGYCAFVNSCLAIEYTFL